MYALSLKSSCLSSARSKIGSYHDAPSPSSSCFLFIRSISRTTLSLERLIRRDLLHVFDDVDSKLMAELGRRGNSAYVRSRPSRGHETKSSCIVLFPNTTMSSQLDKSLDEIAAERRQVMLIRFFSAYFY
jgi:hypothetical protein